MNVKPINSAGSITLVLTKLIQFLEVFFCWTIYGPGKTLIYTLGWLFLAVTAFAVHAGLEVGVMVVVAGYFLVIHIILEVLSRQTRRR